MIVLFTSGHICILFEKIGENISALYLIPT